MTDRVRLMHGDCIVKMKLLPSDSVDSVVTDPPAGISFMGKNWDSNKGGSKQWIAWLESVAVEMLRVLKPGAHGLVWAIPRTSHWTATALEQAGFEIRDVVTHCFGSGFPKSQNIGKAMDKAAGAEREVIGVDLKKQAQQTSAIGTAAYGDYSGNPGTITAPATDEAKQWDGWGTALKPASEHWILVRKPLSEKTVAKNVLKYGTGGINVDASRIEGAPRTTHSDGNYTGSQANKVAYSKTGEGYQNQAPAGRFPANLVFSHHEECVLVGVKQIKGGNDPRRADGTKGGHTYQGDKNVHSIDHSGFSDSDGKETVEAWNCHAECAVAELDRQSGVLDPGGQSKKPRTNAISQFGIGVTDFGEHVQYKDKGGASRFFYCAKASKKDKGADNGHPTVKSTKLMEYLIRMITPPGGTVLDPFMGSGSTGVAALKAGFKFIGIERESEYGKIAHARIAEKYFIDEMESSA